MAAASATLWQAALTKHGWPIDREAKWHGIQSGEVPPDLADELFAAVAAAPVTCFVTVLRPIAGKRMESEFFKSEEDTYATGSPSSPSAFSASSPTTTPTGVIVLDSRRREVDDRMRRFFERIKAEGTGYRQLDRLVHSLLLGPSHFSVGLQVADLVVATTLKSQHAPGDASRWF